MNSTAYRDDDGAAAAIVSSIISRINGFVYRCHNDTEYTPIYVSPTIERFLGYPPSRFFGPGATNIAAITANDSLAELTGVVNDALNRRTAWSHDYMMVAAGGERVWVNECGGGVFDDDGTLKYLEGVVLGIGDRKLVEDANKVMAQAVASNSHDIIRNTHSIFELLKKLRLLALNARIEAARAGGFGAGFTVVAQEIGSMAHLTSDLATKINQSTASLRAALQARDMAGEHDDG